MKSDSAAPPEGRVRRADALGEGFVKFVFFALILWVNSLDHGWWGGRAIDCAVDALGNAPGIGKYVDDADLAASLTHQVAGMASNVADDIHPGEDKLRGRQNTDIEAEWDERIARLARSFPSEYEAFILGDWAVTKRVVVVMGEGDLASFYSGAIREVMDPDRRGRYRGQPFGEIRLLEAFGAAQIALTVRKPWMVGRIYRDVFGRRNGKYNRSVDPSLLDRLISPGYRLYWK